MSFPALIQIEKHTANNIQAVSWGLDFVWGFCFFACVQKNGKREGFGGIFKLLFLFNVVKISVASCEDDELCSLRKA